MTEAEQGPGYLVKRVQQSLRRHCDSALKPTGLSMAQYSVLRALAAHPEASAAELARLCFVTRQSLQDVLNTLRADGHVEPSSAPVRGRARSLQLTTRGARLLAGGDAAGRHVESMMLQGMSAPTRNRLAELLMRCAENLETADVLAVE
ncbi:MarR family transcriptional regulator [Mycobacterium ahvazicum]|uniref:MarR family transcriptional regulator n=1 Tax=Mycobacterium ahvazicum TaxID=1964395 RepID=A0A2K4YDF8_9MYCO|nr:MarR family transcriptional regulator [Mycobacterium ahvazicum]SOX54829.1 MarR family transcriptional regulator [Mycobacterium ahvazicum]